MIFTDYTKIKRVNFKIPELMSDTAQEEVIALFNEIKTLKDKISDLRMEALSLEPKLKEKEKKWQAISSLIDIEYETFEKDVINNPIYVGFNFGTEINKHIH